MDEDCVESDVVETGIGAVGAGGGGRNIEPSDETFVDIGKPIADAGRTIDGKFEAEIEGFRKRFG